VLCLTGDGVQNGDQPQARPVFDLDSVSLLRLARMLRDEGKFLSGRKIETPPSLFLGAAANPFAPPFEYRPVHLHKKVQAGAQFIQTQYCFDLPRLQEFMHKVREEGLDQKVFILVGVGPLRSWKAARWMTENVPGVVIPKPVLDRLARTPSHLQREEGKRLCVEIIRQVREIPGVSGVHVMATRQESLVAEIIEEAGLLPRQAQTRPPDLVAT